MGNLAHTLEGGLQVCLRRIHTEMFPWLYVSLPVLYGRKDHAEKYYPDTTLCFDRAGDGRADCRDYHACPSCRCGCTSSDNCASGDTTGNAATIAAPASTGFDGSGVIVASTQRHHSVS